MKRKLTCLDLFCGAGGLSKGFLDAGYNVVLGVDYDDAALKTFQENHGSATAMKLDLFNHENLNCISQYSIKTKQPIYDEAIDKPTKTQMIKDFFKEKT